MTRPLLTTRNLTKRFGSVHVLNDVSLSVAAGEIHALLGANGAGKSTAVRIIAGLLPRTDGEMCLEGEDYSPRRKRDAEAAGIHIVQQELNLIPTLTVAENLRFTRLPHHGGFINFRELNRHAGALLNRCGMPEIDPRTIVGKLGVGPQQMIEIASALDQDCRLLILDEPTAALSAAETERLFGWLEELRSEGVGIVYISHRLDEVSRLADRITVLRDGTVVGSYEAGELTPDEWVERMSGETQSARTEHECHSQSSCVLRVEGVGRDWIRDVSFEVYRGERVGIAGLVGSGRTELLRMLYGADHAATGRVHVAEVDVGRPRHPRESVQAGLVMVTEDRKQDGLLLSLAVRVNATLASLMRVSWLGWILPTREHDRVEDMCERLDIRCRSVQQPAATLSGGNQQKVVMAKWLLRDAEVFLFDEPTRGIDVPARRRIYELMDALAKDGKGIVVVSSDVDELMETCDRILVMSHGQLTDEFQRHEWSREGILRAAFSGYRSGAKS